MIQEPRFIKIQDTLVIGMHTTNMLSNDQTAYLWKKLMPRRNEIRNRVDSNFYDIKIYPKNLKMQDFTPLTEFDKWAAVAVYDIDKIPAEMESLKIPAGNYAVFIHKGPANQFPVTLQHIFADWLPKSAYRLSERPHFEILTKDYNPMDPNAQEEVWIPVDKK